uniref:Uncharacterized protein n=1 Tax=Aegilops tauschii subsp. strangulata TaxID=200361 RepID=A0A453D424_AEGTS
MPVAYCVPHLLWNKLTISLHFTTNSRCFCHYDQVHDSGHMVPMDQPKAALEMLKRWTSGNLSDASGSQRLDFAM